MWVEDVIMLKFWQITGFIGAIALLAGCATEPTATVDSPVASPQASPQVSSHSVAIAPAPVPLRPGNANQLASANLLPATTVMDRLSTIPIGRPDPFASVATNPVAFRQTAIEPVPAAPQTISFAPPAAPAFAPQAVQPPAIPSFAPLPLPPVSANSLPAPGGSVAVAPSAPPISLARQIEVTGVVQVGDRTHAIVQVPNESSSRYVGVGEYLANGRVQLKRIDMQNGEPRVIFVQNGEEVVRMVEGASTM